MPRGILSCKFGRREKGDADASDRRGSGGAAAALVAGARTPAVAGETPWSANGTCTARGSIALFTDETRSTLVDFLQIISAADRFRAPGDSTLVTNYRLADDDPVLASL
jgi:hypothetical protein